MGYGFGYGYKLGRRAGGGAASVSELIETLTLATDAYADSNANASPLRTDLLTHPVSGVQYFAYHADNLPSVVSGKVALGTIAPDNTVVVDKSAVTTDAVDGHNFFALGVDGDGDLLISGDMHGSEINFQRLPGGSIDLTAWMTAPIEPGATDEASVTYPLFLPSGDVLYFYRDGGSGDGKLVLKRWDHTTHQMALVGVIVDGNADGVSFYPLMPFLDAANNEIDCGGNWRDTTAINTNHDLIFYRLTTDDDWATVRAEKSDGSAQTLPITVANAEYALTRATNTGMANVGSIKRDAAGNPQLFSYADPGDGITQFFAVRHNGSAWQPLQWIPENVQLQSGKPFSYVGVTTDTRRTMSGARVAPEQSDRTILLTRSETEGQGVWALICERADLTQWTWRQLDSADTGNGWAASIDPHKFATTGEVHGTVMRCQIKLTGDADIGPQTLKKLRFRPQSDPYVYTPPTALFDPDDYAGCIAYVAPRVGGVKVKGGSTLADVEKLLAVYDARDGSALFVQAVLNDAPKLVWDHYGKRKGGILAVSANSDFMRCTDAGKLAALTGVNVPFAIIAVITFTTVAAAQSIFSAGVTADSTRFFHVGLSAAALPQITRNVGGTAKTYLGSNALSAGVPYVISYVFTGTTGYARVNKVQQGAAVDLAFGGTFTPSQLSLLHRWRGGANDLYLNGTLGDVPIYTTVPSAADLGAIEDRLASDHGITF